jgi:hypothetical protein
MPKWNVNNTALRTDRDTLAAMRDDYGIRSAHESAAEANGRHYHPVYRQAFTYVRHPHIRYVIGELANLTLSR